MEPPILTFPVTRPMQVPRHSPNSSGLYMCIWANVFENGLFDKSSLTSPSQKNYPLLSIHSTQCLVWLLPHCIDLVYLSSPPAPLLLKTKFQTIECSP